jgi:hypothetical protein
MADTKKWTCERGECEMAKEVTTTVELTERELTAITHALCMHDWTDKITENTTAEDHATYLRLAERDNSICRKLQDIIAKSFS